MGRRRRKPSIIIRLYLLFLLLIFLLPVLIISCGHNKEAAESTLVHSSTPDVSYEILSDSYKYALSSGFEWVDLLSYAASYKVKDGKAPTVQQLVEALTNDTYKYDNKAFKTNKQFYSILLDDIQGTYSYKKEKSESLMENTESSWMPGNGIRLFYPIPSGFLYTHNDDFGAPRSFNDITSHEGNDIMADDGTPVIAVESGYVENIGWNDAGGYRISIRSNNGKRLYYYAHFSKYSEETNPLVPWRGSKPREKKRIEAGTVIGYVGSTGNSKTPGTSGLFPPHLHLEIGVSPKENETTWINPYGFIKFIESYGIKQNMDNIITVTTE